METTVKLPIAATEAKEVSLKNSITIDGISEMIRSQCQNGNSTLRIFDLTITTDVMQKLLELGYSISQVNGQYKENIFIISW